MNFFFDPLLIIFLKFSKYMVMFSLTLWLSASLIVRWWETHGLPDSYFLKFVEISFTDKNTINFWKFSRDYSEDYVFSTCWL